MENNKHIDTLAGFYKDNYPILSLSDSDIFENHIDNLQDILKNCVWFQCASKRKRVGIVNKLLITSSLVEYIKKIISIKYPNLFIKHISIGGSYLFKDKPNDIDFNIIISGSHFSYTEIYEVDEINKKLRVNIKKISIMIFGEKDFLFKTNVCDTIEVEDYIHTSLCMREGLVFLMRNAPIYGCLYNDQKIDRRNLLVRLKRQLFHAQLMLEDRVDLHRNKKDRLLKSVSRITEAYLYLSVEFPHLNLSFKKILKREKILSKSLDITKIISWLNEANSHIENSSINI